MLTRKLADSTQWDGSKWQVLADNEVKGLYLRINEDSRTFLLRYSVGGRPKKLTIGKYGILTIERARQVARQMLGQVAQGIDPAHASGPGPTVQKLIDDYIRLHAKPHKESWKEDDWRIKKYFPEEWKSRLTTEVTRKDIVELMQSVGKKHPVTANRLARLISVMWECARDWGMFPEDRRNPAEGVTLFREEARDRWVKPDEMPRLIAAINAHPTPQARAALWLLILLPARKREIVNLRWDNVDLKRKEIRLVKTKNGKTHYLPLSEKAIEILAGIRRRKTNPYVLAGDGRGPYSRLDKAWAKIRKRAKLPDLTIHDIRRTIGSWMAQKNVSLHTIGRLLNHSSPKITEIYARLADSTKRDALDDYTEELLEVLKVKPPAG